MHKMTTSTNKNNDVITALKRPKKATIEFLKQFARAYQYNAERIRVDDCQLRQSSPLSKEKEAFSRDVMHRGRLHRLCGRIIPPAIFHQQGDMVLPNS